MKLHFASRRPATVLFQSLRAYPGTLLEVSSGQGNQHNQTVLGRAVRVARGNAAKLVLSLSIASMAFFTTAVADEGGYVPPRFLSGANNPLAAKPLALQQASPLAGGPAAAQGGQFMDVQGNSIVLPAQYCQSCPAESGGFGGVANYGDPMSVDFGGYGPDQAGPHYFDVSLDSVFLQRDAFDGAPPLISAGAGGPTLDILSGGQDYKAGWRIAARYDLGPLSVLEGTYMGIYDFGFNKTITSEQASVAVGLPALPNFLFSAPAYGIPAPIPTLDAASSYTFNYKADLQSTEISYRRYWLGYNSRVSGTWLMGFRYLRMTERFAFNTVTQGGNAALSSRSENDLLGFQFGGDGWYTLRQGLRIGTETKAGIYNNRFKFNSSGDFGGVGGAPNNFSNDSKGDQVAFVAESGVTVVADILPSLSLRGGYQVLYLNSLATVGGNAISLTTGSAVASTQGDALYHGFHGGIEYVW